MSTYMYGIKNCDTIKKARKWLEDNNVEFEFHDVRKDGLSAKKLESWIKAVGWETLLNKRGTTWRQLPDDVKDNVDQNSAKQIMLENPAIIKRPVLEANGQLYVGFNKDQYQKIFA